MSDDSAPEEKKLRFDIAASVVRQLGEELISDEVTALIELAKNAWDADSDWLEVAVEPQQTIDEDTGSQFVGTKGYISISDGGMGMTLPDIERGWLTISHSKKRGMKARGEKTPKGRTPLGDKGLGRLSTQRLGNQLDMFTRQDGEMGHHIAFCWSDFTDDNVLSAVNVFHKEMPDLPVGTKLIISGLRSPEAWEGDSLQDLADRLAQLTFPFGSQRLFHVLLQSGGHEVPLNELADKAKSAAQGGFSFNFEEDTLIVNGSIRLSKLLSTSDKQFQALLGKDNGRDFFHFLTSTKNLTNINYVGENGVFIQYAEKHLTTGMRLRPDPSGTKNERGAVIPASPGPFSGEIFDFNYKETGELSIFDSTSQFGKFIKSNSGIKVFRDGFGVRPYGYDGNDWLKLGESQTSGGSFYGLRPFNTIGYVNITEELNSTLKEKTDREGFVRNNYSDNFSTLMKCVVADINLLYEQLRRGLTEYRKKLVSETTDVIGASENLDKVRQVATAASSIESRVEALSTQLDTIASMVGAAQGAAKLPLLASKETEDALREVNHFLEETRRLFKEVTGLLPAARELGKRADYLEVELSTFQSQLNDVAELAGLGLTAEALTHEVQSIALRLSEQTRIIAGIVEKGVSKNEIVRYLDHVHSSVSALRSQLSHLAPSLRFVREQKDSLSVASFVEEMARYFHPRLEKNGISIRLAPGFADFKVLMNKGRLTQVIDNLVLNAEYWLKVAAENGFAKEPAITFELSAPFIRVSDNGLGVEPSVEEVLFQPFVTRKLNGEGRGLGLFICKQLLEPIGADLTLLYERNAHGRRYVFQIDLTGAMQDDR